MKVARALTIVLIFLFLATPSLAGDKVGLVIGKNLKTGMPLKEVFALLGIPKTFVLRRGTEPRTDSVAMEYPANGVVIHFMNKKKVVEEIEVLPSFKGTFSAGIKIGTKFNDLIAKYGMPKSLHAQVARYPDQGMFFILEKEALVSARLFRKNSKILDLQLINK
ncbi:MAG: hypothetical protein ACE5E9_10145 [Nitrospinaceae bacterium]